MDFFFEKLGNVAQIMVFVVGITQLLKLFFEPKGKRVKIVIAIFVGLAGGFIKQYVDVWLFETLLGLSLGVVFYDYVLKKLENSIKFEKDFYDRNRCKCQKDAEIEGLR